MTGWEKILILPTTTIMDAISIIDTSAMQIALVVDHDRHLLGTVTDGDIRRGILKDLSFDRNVSEIMYQDPTAVKQGVDKEIIISIMKTKKLLQIPVIDDRNRVVGLEIWDELLKTRIQDNWVVLMAGGQGLRLRPHTENCPKPMLKVGGKPILETIMENIMGYGFRKFIFTVNYRAKMIEEYFGNGKNWGVQIDYINENKRLGTAGALSLLPEKPEKPIIVMNGDLLTKINFLQLLDYHQNHAVKATVCVREYYSNLPYGVIKIADHYIEHIEEKPRQHFFINAGIYVLEPSVISGMPVNRYLDMTELIKTLLQKKEKVAAFPVREYWIDVGNESDFIKANSEFEEVF